MCAPFYKLMRVRNSRRLPAKPAVLGPCRRLLIPKHDSKDVGIGENLLLHNNIRTVTYMSIFAVIYLSIIMTLSCAIPTPIKLQFRDKKARSSPFSRCSINYYRAVAVPRHLGSARVPLYQAVSLVMHFM